MIDRASGRIASKHKHQSAVTDVHFVGSALLTSCADGSVSLWSGEQQLTQRPHSTSATVTVHPSQQLFVSASKESIAVHDMALNTLVKLQERDSAAVKFHPDGLYY